MQSSSITPEKARKELKKDSGKRLSDIIKKHHRTYQVEMQQDALKQAILFAEDPERPDRTFLLNFYKETMRDPNVLNAVRNNILKAIHSPFGIFKEGSDLIDDKATKMLSTLWFDQLRWLYHITPYYGPTLAQFRKMVPPKRDIGIDLEFSTVEEFPRMHVRPETGEIILDPSNEKGIPYREEPFNEWILEMGNPFDLGLLNIAAREVIWKNYSRSDASRYLERYGIPWLFWKTMTTNEKELDEKADMAKNMGTNGWSIADADDSAEILESSNKNGVKPFIDQSDHCDSQNRLLLSGQKMLGEDTAFVGSVEAAERIVNDLVEYFMRTETYYHNNVSIPFFIKHGYPLEGMEFKYLEFVKEEEKEGAETDGDDPPEPPKPPKPEPKKATANFTRPFQVRIGKGGAGTLTERVNQVYHSECCQKGNLTGFENLQGLEAAVDLEKAVNKAAKKVYKKKLKAGQVDREVFLGWTAKIYSGVLQGYGAKLDELQYGSNDHIMLTQLRHNAHVFSIFKAHHHTNELVQALVDEDGNTRSFAKFKEAAGLINTRYNKNWLKTEHTQAILSARNAKRWQVIESRKDIFPHVEYVVVKDERLTQICADLAGGIFAIDDPILNTIAPSNHFGCRSFLKSTKKGLVEKTTGEDIHEAFDNNPGKSGEVFSNGHPYYTVKGEYKKAASNLFGRGGEMPINKKQLASNIKALNKLDRDKYSDVVVFPDSGGWYALHKLADKKDLAHNKKVAKAMAQRGYAVEVREHLTDGTPNPELIVNGVLSDLKTPTKPYSLDNLLKKASKVQGINNVVYRVLGSPDLKDIAMGLKRGFHNRKKIEWVDVVLGSKVVRITREMYLDGVMMKELRMGLE